MTLDNLDPRTAALLVLDLQNAFIHDKGTLGVSGVDTQRLSAIVPVLADLIPRCQAAGIPVIWTVQEHFAVYASRARKKLAGHTSRRKQVSALAGTWDEEIVEELKPLAAVNPAYVIRKHRFGAFYETRLEMMLKMLGTRTLFVAGTTANACVETSIREAYLRDYDVVALDDCISGVNAEWEETAKKVWKQYFCEISDAAEMRRWIDAKSAPRTLSYGHMLLMVTMLTALLAYLSRGKGDPAAKARILQEIRESPRLGHKVADWVAANEEALARHPGLKPKEQQVVMMSGAKPPAEPPMTPSQLRKAAGLDSGSPPPKPPAPPTPKPPPPPGPVGPSGKLPLPGADRAIIDRRKVTDYALNPEHPVGGNKAKVFESALGFKKDNADDLIAQLKSGVKNNPAIEGKLDQFGQRYTMDIPVSGPTGSGVVRTGWIYKVGSYVPELTTLFVK
jgi:nicotinamidase-related amidase